MVSFFLAHSCFKVSDVGSVLPWHKKSIVSSEPWFKELIVFVSALVQ